MLRFFYVRMLNTRQWTSLRVLENSLKSRPISKSRLKYFACISDLDESCAVLCYVVLYFTMFYFVFVTLQNIRFHES